MAWQGYFAYDGTEIINVDRTEAYWTSQSPTWFYRAYGNGSLGTILQQTYVSPMADDAPWTDPDRLDSYNFWGVYPLEVTGIEDSTRESQVVEYIRDGGSPGRVRHGTRSAVFNVALAGANEAAVHYGFNWLKAVLLGRVCSPSAQQRCGGLELEYFASEPDVDPDAPDLPVETDPVYAELDGGDADSAYTVEVDGGNATTVFTDEFDGGSATTTFPIELSEPFPEPFEANAPDPSTDPTGCLAEMTRHLHNVKFIDGPEVTARKYLSDGTVVWTATFTAVAGDPYEYSRHWEVVERFLGADVVDPYPQGITGTYDMVGYAHTDAGCPPQVWEAIYDPLCPALVAPPAPVDIPAGCFTPTDDWWRRYITIPEDLVPLWGSAVPIINVTAQYDDLRQVRLRLYADPTGAGDPEAEECEYVGDLLVSYVPQGYTLIIDAHKQAVYARDLDGLLRRADSLVFASDGKPIMWPELTCGYGYILTVDTADAQVFPMVDLSVATRTT
jgi:hypothetical protein